MISETQAYEAMVLFLEGFCRRTQSADVLGLLGDLMLRDDGTTADPAACSDWEAAVGAIKEKSRNPSSVSGDMLSIHTYDDLLTLHLLVMEAKFQKNPDNLALLGSHRVGDLALDIVSALNAAVCMDQGPKDAPDWIEWQKFTANHREYPLVLSRLSANRFWITEEPLQQRQYLRDLISPYIASESLMDEMFVEARQRK